MAFTEFYMQTTGSNLNAGSTSSDTAAYTSTSGNWDGTSVFTPTDGATTSASVSVGNWVSIYPNANSVTPYIAQVTAVGAGANGTITLSTTNKMGTAPTSNSGSTSAKAGGAWADLGMVASGAALNTGTVALATRINIKAGTYSGSTSSRSLGLAGTAAIPLWLRGYKTTIGDQDGNNVAVAGTDIPSFTFTTGYLTVAGTYTWLSNLDFTSASTVSGTLVISGGSSVAYGIRSTNTGTNANSRALYVNGATISIIRGTFVATSSAPVIGVAQATGMYVGNYLTGGNAGMSGSTFTTYIMNNVFDSIGGDAIIFSTGGGMVEGNSFYAPTGHGISITGNLGSPLMISNNYFEGVPSGKNAVNNAGTSTNALRLLANGYYNCAGNISGSSDTPLMFENSTLASSGFTAPGSHNFTPASSIQGIGFPGKFEGTSTFRGYKTLGALQLAGGSGRRKMGVLQ